MKRAFCFLFFAVFLLMGGMAVSAGQASSNVVELSNFRDTADRMSVNYFRANNIVDGYPDSEFKPDAPLTRAQLAKILAKTFRLAPDPDTAFTDVGPEHWAYPYVRAAGRYIADGAGEFHPERAVTYDTLMRALEAVLQTGADQAAAPEGKLNRGGAMDVLYDVLKENDMDKELKIGNGETIPQESFGQYENTVFSNRPMYFSAPGYGSFGSPGDFSGYAYASWSAGEQKASFYAKVFVEDDCYEYVLRELSFCGADDSMSTIEGRYDILRNGEKIADSISGAAYGFEYEYFKFYSEGEQWHMSAYVTSRRITGG